MEEIGAIHIFLQKRKNGEIWKRQDNSYEKLGSAPDPTKMTDWSVSVGSVTSPTDPTLSLRIESGRSDFWSEFWSVGGRILVGRSVGST